MISASVLMRLDDDGVLDVDAPVADVVEWGAGNPTVTPAQLISNSSGLIGLQDGFGYESYLCQFNPAGTLQDCAEQIFTTPDDDAEVIPPDTEFRYGGAQWTIAGAVAEAASGRTWAQLVDELIAAPCGLESLGYYLPIGFEYPADFNGDPSTLPPTDNPNPEAGADVTAPDYAQLMLMQLRGGMWATNESSRARRSIGCTPTGSPRCTGVTRGPRTSAMAWAGGWTVRVAASATKAYTAPCPGLTSTMVSAPTSWSRRPRKSAAALLLSSTSPSRPPYSPPDDAGRHARAAPAIDKERRHSVAVSLGDRNWSLAHGWWGLHGLTWEVSIGWYESILNEGPLFVAPHCCRSAERGRRGLSQSSR